MGFRYRALFLKFFYYTATLNKNLKPTMATEDRTPDETWIYRVIIKWLDPDDELGIWKIKQNFEAKINKKLDSKYILKTIFKKFIIFSICKIYNRLAEYYKNIPRRKIKRAFFELN